MIIWKLFLVFIQVGTFSIGGGLAAIPLIQDLIVTQNQWMSLKEFTDLITIAQMTPGPIAVNSATFIGLRMAGLPGAILATLGCILPSLIIVMTLAYLYKRFRQLGVLDALLNGLKPAIVAFITSAGLTILDASLTDTRYLPQAPLDWIACILFIAAFIILRKWKLDPIMVMVGTGIIGGIIYLFI
ncbi:chromate transporter [Eremococcus coleocola]|uniref:Chromate transport protein n=1 Tax=Eremococcus coleocola ACS-139-V-Col8 TaxID=908337 RepID=E4KRB0_9LACT|nr:chromate transporter [Eremococcus coleocola]EFR30514.1 chromate transport protein [Eremococcus coleocola ACS-139-V-Col8]